MKNRLLLMVALLSAMALTFACGGPAANSNNANGNKNANANTSVVNTVANTVANAANTVANTVSNAVSTNKNANTKATNTATNTAANKTATAKPKKGDTFECNDGTFSDAKTSQGACSGHQGIKKALK